MLMQMMRRRQGLDTDDDEDGRQVKVAPLGTLKAAVEAHAALKWDSRMESIAGTWQHPRATSRAGAAGPGRVGAERGRNASVEGEERQEGGGWNAMVLEWRPGGSVARTASTSAFLVQAKPAR